MHTTTIVLRFLPRLKIAATCLAILICGVGGSVYAQPSDDRLTIQEIKPVVPAVTLGKGDRVLLSILVTGSDGNEDQSLASNVKLTWYASDGELEVYYDTTRAIYVAPRIIGTHTVTASAGSECIGEAADCTATFTINVRTGGGCYGPILPSPTPTALILIDAEGNEYEVFTPWDKVRIDGSDFRILTGCGAVPEGEYIGVRMFENGPASNAGMSYHMYTLSGDQYKISIVDAAVKPITSYALNHDVEVCIPVPDELRTKLSSTVMVNINDDGTLTEISSSVRISPSLIVCGYTNTLPATLAAGVPGTPPPKPAETLPATGAAAPSSAGVVVWTLLLGIALIAVGTLCLRILDRDEFNRV